MCVLDTNSCVDVGSVKEKKGARKEKVRGVSLCSTVIFVIVHLSSFLNRLEQPLSHCGTSIKKNVIAFYGILKANSEDNVGFLGINNSDTIGLCFSGFNWPSAEKKN